MSQAVGPEGSNESVSHERSLPPLSHRLGWSAAPKTFLGLRTNPNGEKGESFFELLPRVAPRHPPQPWAAIHKPFRLAGVPRQRV